MSENVLIEQPVPAPEDAIPAHLTRRLQANDFVVVELGHRFTPIVLNNARRFDDESWYFGVETWIRDSGQESPLALNHWRTIFADQNVEFVTHNPGGSTQKVSDGDTVSVKYRGEYDPTTILADEIADEVFLSNVFTDPMIARYQERTKALLGEAKRLMKPDGKLVLRETITPEIFRFGAGVLAREGLELEEHYMRSDSGALWSTLEHSYGDRERTTERSYYQFIGKSTQSL